MPQPQNRSVSIVSDITVFNKYARFIPHLHRRELWPEICDRNSDMHKKRFPFLADRIDVVYDDFVVSKKVLPSMRSAQFGGTPIERCESRMFNCAYMPAESSKFFSELMFLLLGGTGVGYSVQKRHVNQLPKIKTPESDLEVKFQVQDSIVGWADAVKVVAKAFFNAGTLPRFDYSDIRDKGELLVTSGGRAPGPEPLKNCIDRIIPIFRQAIGRRLKPIEVHDIACLIADAVRAGGIRRAAMIALFDRDDQEMLTCKSWLPVEVTHIHGTKEADGRVFVEFVNRYGVKDQGLAYPEELNTWSQTGKLPFWVVHPQRERSNNSAILLRGTVTKDEFRTLMEKVEASGCGEPGIYWTNDLDWGTNPCVEIALKPYQMCNLSTINAGAVTDQADYNAKARAAAFIGTLQASYTDFHYLNPKWKRQCEEEALLGVSMTGIASGTLDRLDMTEAAHEAVAMNREIAGALGIRPAARVTCVKPEGTASLVVGSSSGIHAWHAPYYIRRMRAGKNEALAQYMQKAVPGLVEDDLRDPNQVVLSFPQKAPEGAVMRDESMLALLERVKKVALEWVAPGHQTGTNGHNVSCTISVKDDAWETITEWMWANKEHYNGIAVMPHYAAGAYAQAPFEDITKEQYEAMLPLLEGMDISQVFEDNGDGVDLVAEVACAGGQCELVY